MSGIISKQGMVSTSGTVVYKVPGTEFFTQITLIKLYNRSDYRITLKKYSAESDDLREVYSLTLTGGDHLSDETPYILLPGDYLEITSDITDTNYFIQGAGS